MGIDLTGDNATWFTGIASLFIGIIALFGERIINHFFGPRLKVEFSDAWECTEDGDYGKLFGCAISGNIDARLIRIKVENTGKKSVSKCYGKITRTYLNGTELQGFIPFHLTWASRQHTRVKLFKSKSEIDLAPGDTDYLNIVICWKQNEKVLMPCAAYPYSADKYFPIGKYLFQITLFGSNCNAETIKIEVNHPGEWRKLTASKA